MEAAYRTLHRTGELRRRAMASMAGLRSCTLCPHDCGTDRLAGDLGRCRASAELRISHAQAHFGEEACIRGHNGAGTIFFAGCSFACVYCQNYEISQGKLPGETWSIGRLAAAMVALQRAGCHNLDLVTPTHYIPQILMALDIACQRGVNLPIVYNSNAYENAEGMALLDGVVDIYLPDFKYGDDTLGKRYSRVRDISSGVHYGLREMWRQVGPLQTNGQGIAQQGMIIRHLVLPDDIAGSEAVLRFIAEEIGPDVTLSLMAQYYPSNKAATYPELNRHISPAEYDRVVELALKLGLRRLLLQDIPGSSFYGRQAAS